MKLLFENWKRFLNEQQEQSLNDPSTFYKNKIDSIIDGQIVVSTKGSAEYQNVKLQDGTNITGYLISKPPSNNDGPCLTARKIDYVVVEPKSGGWGSLLYEIVLEILSKNNSYLMPDRWSTQPEAVEIWKRFMNRSDIEKIPLDTLYNQFTPQNNNDNCNLNMLHWYVNDPNYAGRVYSDVKTSPEYKAQYSEFNKALKLAAQIKEKEKRDAKINQIKNDIKQLDAQSNKFKSLATTDLKAAQSLANKNVFGVVFKKKNTNVIDYGIEQKKIIIK